MKRNREPAGQDLDAEDTWSTEESAHSSDMAWMTEGSDDLHPPKPPSVKAAHRDAKRRRKVFVPATQTQAQPEEEVIVISDDESMEVDELKSVELKYRASVNDAMRLDKRIAELQKEKALVEAHIRDYAVEMKVIVREQQRRAVPVVRTAVSHRGKTIVLPDTLPEDLNELPKKFVQPSRVRRVEESSDESTQLVFTQE